MAELLWRCSECHWRGPDSDLLKAQNPFDREITVSGCPSCKEINTFENMCDEPNCDQIAGCGWPSDDKGYRRTCYKHSVWAKEKGK